MAFIERCIRDDEEHWPPSNFLKLAPTVRIGIDGWCVAFMSLLLPPHKKKDNDDGASRAADDLAGLLGDGVAEVAEDPEEPETAQARRRGPRRAAVAASPAAASSEAASSNCGSSGGQKYRNAWIYADGTPIVCLACKKEKQRPDPAFPEQKVWWKFHGSEDDPQSHSAFDGYCDHIWTPNNSNSNKSNFRVTVAVTVTVIVTAPVTVTVTVTITVAITITVTVTVTSNSNRNKKKYDLNKQQFIEWAQTPDGKAEIEHFTDFMVEVRKTMGPRL